MQSWLIIGGGTAGAYLASRLLDIYPKCNVTIIESGKENWDDPHIRDDDQIGSVYSNPEYVKTIVAPEGNVLTASTLGGGSSVNGGYAVFPSDQYLTKLQRYQQSIGDTGKLRWVEIKEYLKEIIPTTTVTASNTMNTLNTLLNKKLNTQVIPDTFFKTEGNRISSVSFLDKYRKDSRLTIYAECVVQKLVENTNKDKVYVHALNNKSELVEFTADHIVLSAGAATPEILLRSKKETAPETIGKVLCHTGFQYRVKGISGGNGQIFASPLVDPTKNAFTEQILFYGDKLHIFDLAPDVGWTPTLASRGDLYYKGVQRSKERDEAFTVFINTVYQKLREFDIYLENEAISMTYHMVGGSQHVVSNFRSLDLKGVYIVDLSILPLIPDGNTAWMAFMIAEKFIQEFEYQKTIPIAV